MPYYKFVSKRYLFAVDYEKLFGYEGHPFYFPRHPFYFSLGLFYLNRIWDKVVFHEHNGSSSTQVINELFSYDSRYYGMRFLLGKKYIVGKDNDKVNEVWDFHIGIGYSYNYTKSTILGASGINPTDDPQDIVLYSNPKTSLGHRFVTSIIFGVKYGIGWK